jgi:hypothetical protein
MTRATIEPRVLLDGLAMVESPRWHEGRLWFPHWGTPEINPEERVRANRCRRRDPRPDPARPGLLRHDAWRSRPTHPVHDGERVLGARQVRSNAREANGPGTGRRRSGARRRLAVKSGPAIILRGACKEQETRIGQCLMKCDSSGSRPARVAVGDLLAGLPTSPMRLPVDLENGVPTLAAMVRGPPSRRKNDIVVCSFSA